MQAALPPQLPAFERRILAGESASAVLQGWCQARGQPPLAAKVMRGTVKSPDRLVLTALAARRGQVVLYRRVTLACGGVVLSWADNWYLPVRLTPAMNRALEATDAPFGLVARPLAFTRRTLAAHVLPSRALEIRAVLSTAAGAPFSYVIEQYVPALP